MANNYSSKLPELQGPCYLKLATSNVVAGSIIGKNGANISAMTQSTGCTLRLSSSNCFFPGTSDRVLIISGDTENMRKALYMILDIIANAPTAGSPHEDRTAQSNSVPSGMTRISCRLVVPKSVVSVIIGIGGAQIKQVQEATGARIQISSREEGVDERLVNIQGTLDSVREAAGTIAKSIQADQNLKNHMYVEYAPAMSYGPAGGHHHGAPSMAAYAAHPYGGAIPGFTYPPDILHFQSEVFVQVADTLVGAVIGRNGSNLTTISEQTGAKVTVSQKNEFYPGTQNRIATIKGSVPQVHAAHIILLQRLNAQQNTMPVYSSNPRDHHNPVGML